MRPIITNLTELNEFLMNCCPAGSQFDISENDEKVLDGIHIYDCPQCGTIHISCELEYEHFNQYRVEINYNHSDEYVFTNLKFKQVLYLLTQEKIIR